MDESTPIRAIVIGVSVLIAIATISAVLMYYNTAKQMASNVGRGQDFASNYEDRIKDILVKGSYDVSGKGHITGTDVKNLLNYFYNDENVEISVAANSVISYYDLEKFAPKMEKQYYGETSLANLDNYDIVMKELFPNQKFRIEINENVELSNEKMGTKISIKEVSAKDELR